MALAALMDGPILCGPRPKLRDASRKPARQLTRGERVIRFIETHCVVPEGDLVGKPVILADFQRLFILAIYDNVHITDTALLSIARKNAKTGTIAFIMLAHLVGPEARENSRIISGAMSRDQAAEVYNLASKCVLLSDKLRPLIEIVPSSKRMIGTPMNVEYQAISAEGKTAHGKSPALAILDEVGQVRGPQSDFIDAITTAQGAYEDPLLIYISTQAATDADLFSIAIDDARNNKPLKTVCHVYAADQKANVMDEDAWRAANPALGKFRSESDMRKQAEKAARMPSFENTFRNLNLNQRVSLFSPFISRSVWEENGDDVPPIDGVTVACGLDLSARVDLCAFIAQGEVEGRMCVWALFWTPELGLKERADRDRQPYEQWAREGWLRTTPGRTVDYEVVARDIADFLEAADVTQIAFDRWRIDLFKKECERLGIDLPLVPFGQGFKDMSPALETLEEQLLNGRIAHGNNPVLTMCAAHAATMKDPSGNRKLAKDKATGRIDGMVALAMACGVTSHATTQQTADLTSFFMNPVIA